MTESTNSMRSANSVEKPVDFAWSGMVENLNGEILFASFVEFFEQTCYLSKDPTKEMKNVFRG